MKDFCLKYKSLFVVVAENLEIVIYSNTKSKASTSDVSCYNLGKITPLLSKNQHVQRVFRIVRCNQSMGNLGEKFSFIPIDLQVNLLSDYDRILFGTTLFFTIIIDTVFGFLLLFFLLIQLSVHDDWPMIDLSRVPCRVVGNKYPCVRYLRK